MRKWLAGAVGMFDRGDVVFLAGSGLIAAGAWHWSPGAGQVAAGVMLILWLAASHIAGKSS